MPMPLQELIALHDSVELKTRVLGVDPDANDADGIPWSRRPLFFGLVVVLDCCLFIGNVVRL